MRDAIVVGLIFVAIFSLIGLAIWVTQSALPLLALALLPSVSTGEGEK